MESEDELYNDRGELTNTGLRAWMDDEGGAVGLIHHGTSGEKFADPETERLWKLLEYTILEEFNPVLDKLYDRIGW